MPVCAGDWHKSRASSHSLINYHCRELALAGRGTCSHIGGLFGWEICTEIVNQRVAIRRADDCSPLSHLVHFFAPAGLTEPLLNDDVRIMTDEAIGSGLILHLPGGQFVPVLGRLRSGNDGTAYDKATERYEELLKHERSPCQLRYKDIRSDSNPLSLAALGPDYLWRET